MNAIMLTTLKEAVRKKTFIVMSVLTFLYLVLWTVLLYYFEKTAATHGMGLQSKAMASVLLTQTGLQFSSMLMCLLTIMLGAGAIAADLENGMVHAILSRPLRRLEYILGKFTGLLILVIAYASVLFFAILLIGLIFQLSTITSLSFLQIISAWLYYLLVPSIVLCITIYGSVVLKVVPNGLLMIFIYILGNIGGMVEMIGTFINNTGVISSGIFLSLISPFHVIYTSVERHLLPSSGIAGEMMRTTGGLSGSGRPPSVWMYVYIAVYAIFFLVLAVKRFSKMDIN